MLQDAGEAALEYHDKHVRGVKASRIQCDEVWSFVHAKKDAEHLEHRATRRRRRVEGLLMQIQIASRTIEFLEEADEVPRRSTEAVN